MEMNQKSFGGWALLGPATSADSLAAMGSHFVEGIGIGKVEVWERNWKNRNRFPSFISLQLTSDSVLQHHED